MLYLVLLEKMVVGDSGSCLMERDLVLPFAPFPGLEIVFDDEDQGETVAEVVWVLKARRFLAVVRAWEDRSFDFQVQKAVLVGRGWKVVEDSLP